MEGEERQSGIMNKAWSEPFPTSAGRDSRRKRVTLVGYEREPVPAKEAFCTEAFISICSCTCVQP